ncbi:hypothetical protein CIG75_07180 [Tumebacillus algifaecis]|uniref:Protein-glutamine gamma-glutamyltransferase-like C-terminal domain-containing protein n=1 Tax=Tumebacillus algifaecis TaxID=1214604 RepID=A0A223CZI8_9BACL|nr:DUF4129 domain-containing protein [Tumebacillus algifaecis]ASS74780.1 hypothetical protein CIG75_07180 [Tumebacillus algifaecis]
MNKAIRKVILFGLASQAFAVTTMFTILSGLLEHGTRYIPAFAGTAVALILVAMLVYRRNNLTERRTFLIAGMVTMGLGVAGMAWIDSAQLLFPLLIFGGLGAFMLLRMSQTIDDMRYIRQSLLDQYKLDLQLIFAFIVFTIFFQDDSTWQTKMVPFFVIFLFLRMTALSMASRLQRGVKGNTTRLETLQNNLPALFVGVILIAAWVLNTIGVPVFRWFVGIAMTVLGPIFYAVGHIVEYLANWLSGHKNPDGQKVIDDLIEGIGVPPDEDFYFDSDAWNPFNETTLFVLAAIGLAILILYFFRRMKRAQQLQAAIGIVEMREFIHSDKPQKGNVQAAPASGRLTEMRKIYRRFLHAMKQTGHKRNKGETALEYIQKISSQQPDLQSSMQELTDYYMQERYGDRSVQDQLPRADSLSRELSGPDKK